MEDTMEKVKSKIPYHWNDNEAVHSSHSFFTLGFSFQGPVRDQELQRTAGYNRDSYTSSNVNPGHMPGGGATRVGKNKNCKSVVKYV